MKRTILILLLVLGAARVWAQQNDTFSISRNLFVPGTDQVNIQITTANYPNNINLRVYNSAGELVRILEDLSVPNAYSNTYVWDGLNVNNTKVASGVYLIVLKTDQYTKMGRILAVQ